MDLVFAPFLHFPFLITSFVHFRRVLKSKWWNWLFFFNFIILQQHTVLIKLSKLWTAWSISTAYGDLNYCEISRSITKPRVRRKIKRRDLHQIVTKICKNWAEYKVALLLNWIYAIAFFWEELKEKKESISRRFGIRHLKFWANTRKPRGWH